MNKIEFDEKTGSFVRREEIQIESVGIDDLEESLKLELLRIVQQVKVMKKRAEEIKAMLGIIKKKAGPNRPAPDSVAVEPLPGQESPFVETPGPM